MLHKNLFQLTIHVQPFKTPG